MLQNPFEDHHFNYFEQKAFLGEYRGKSTTTKSEKKHEKKVDITYGIVDNPPLYLTVLLGVQHYLTMFGGTVSVPLLLASYFCVGSNPLTLSMIINNMFFVSGIATLVQVVIGSRLPIIQGATFALVQPTIQVLSSERFKCKPCTNATLGNCTTNGDHWEPALREIQGAIVSASLLQTILGLSGAIGLMMKVIGPITQTTTIALIALSLVDSVGEFASENWILSVLNLLLTIFCSQVMKKGSFLRTFPVLSSLVISCSVSGALRHFDEIDATDEFSFSILSESKWFQLPYPGKWGLPTFSLTSFSAISMGTLVSIIESFGNYVACSEVAGVKKPPRHAVNRGIAVEGITSIFAGYWGSICGTTSYSENIAAIEVTKVASRQVVIMGASIMIILSLLGKFGSLFLLIPRALIGGMFWALFGSILSVALSNLQNVNLKSNKHMFVLGFSLFNGLVIPNWVTSNKESVNIGSKMWNDILYTFLSTNMMIGCVTSIFLENIIPDDDKGISFFHISKNLFDKVSSKSQKGKKTNSYKDEFSCNPLLKKSSEKNNSCNKQLTYSTCKDSTKEHKSSNISDSGDVYDLPWFLQRHLNGKKWVKFIPFLPYHPKNKF